ncbi:MULTISPECIES: VOC family protein [unclassified Thermoactinomyces]|jgi:PhnB protein|uniref:VOC family protein n=1 Tax=unclassified Thermoactinomyces TaxID=2634588 RepID=UPI0018DBBBA5|nr:MULTISPECIES: VOC family protein [unclassified Thermoactinomyces]MBH8605354.1 VOC family protein [Thermoactinomyces sp. CICC 10522]MBH8609012.1 VOC family protein [Thermoactinomyces sp. CICC 10521]
MNLGFNFYLVLDGNGQEAVNFYENALDAEIVTVVLDDANERVQHAHLKVGNTDFMLSDELPPNKIKSSQVTLYMPLNDAEKAKEVFWKLQDGGQIVSPMQETPWSPAHGVVTDRFGVTWILNTRN